MSSPHGLTVALTIARALRLPIPDERIAQARREPPPGATTLATWTEALVGLAIRLGLVVHARILGSDEVRHAVTQLALPLVFTRKGSDGYETLVVTDCRKAQALGTLILPSGASSEITLSVDELVATWHHAAQPVLVPMAVPGDGPGAWEGPGGNVPPLSRLWRLLAQQKRLLVTLMLYGGMAGLFSLTLPLGVQAIIGLISGGLILQPVVLLIAFVVVGTLAAGGLQLLQLGVVEAVQQRVFARLAFDVVGRVTRARLDAVAGVDLPEVMNRFFEIKTIQKSLGKLLTDGVTAGLQVIFGLLLLAIYHPLLSIFGVTLLGTLSLLFWLTARRGWETSLGESKMKFRVAHWLEEVAKTVRTHKFADRSPLPVDRMDHLVGGYLEFRQAHFRVLVRQFLAVMLVRVLVTGGLLVLGSVLVVKRQITLGQFVASELVIVTVLLAIEKLMASLADVYDILTALKKAGQAASVPQESSSGIAPRLDGDSRGMAIDLRELTFTYPGSSRAALRGITLSVAPGERQGITGPQGSGESTLLAVAAALFPGFDGAMTYDGRSLRDLDAGRLRGTMGWCGMEAALFDGSIEDNVSLGRPGVRTEHVLEALSRVGLDEWLHGLPEGLQTSITQGGSALTQAIARRLVIARAIAGNPRLVLVDGFLDALDTPDRTAMADLLLDPQAPWTLLIVSHHPSILRRCHRVAVLEQGQLAANGPFPDVEPRNTYLRELVDA